ncbi:MAG: MFS transporter [Chloroflexales bacterium]|nr:MFS transporter [Chloroflexales bacterium]
MQRQSGFFDVMAFRDFRLLWFGQFISMSGSMMRVVAVDWQVYHLALAHGMSPALALGTMGLMRVIPMVLSALFAGIAADRYDRRRIVIIASLVSMVSSVVLAITAGYPDLPLWIIYSTVIITSIAGAFDFPARQALIPALVPASHLSQAMSAGVLSWQLATVVGPALAGLIIAGYGVVPLYWFDAVSFLAVVIAAQQLRSVPQTATNTSVALRDALSGVRFVFSKPLLASSMSLDFFATLFGAATSLMPIFATDILHVGATGYGLLRTAPAIGSVIAAVILASRRISRQGPVLLIAVVLFGLSISVAGISHWFPLTLLALACSGASDTVSAVIRNTLNQLLTPNEMRGRMTAVNMIFVSGGPQLGEFVVGVAASIVGASIAVAVGGLLCVGVVGSVAWLVPSLRRLNHPEDVMVIGDGATPPPPPQSA